MKMWCLGTWFSGRPDSVRLVVVLNLEVFSNLNDATIPYFFIFSFCYLKIYTSSVWSTIKDIMESFC